MKISIYLSEKIKNLSFLLTVLIVVLHSNMAMLSAGYIQYFEHVITQDVTRIAVPLFFLISGFLFFINYNGTFEDYKRKIISRTRSLLIPYIFFLLLGSILIFIINETYTTIYFAKILKNGILNSPPIFYPLWFLRDLYVIVLFAPLVYVVVRKIPILLIFLIGVWALGKNPFIFPCTEAILFFSIGAYLTTKENFLEQRKHKGTWLLFSLWLFLCFLNTYICNYVIALPYATHCLILILGILTIWKLYDKLYPYYSDYIKTANICQYSFFIYLIHEPILTVFKKIGLRIMGYSSLSISFIYIVAPILTICIAYFIGHELKRYAPRLLLFITGGRINH